MAAPVNPLLTAALAYAAMGWPVCPCDPRTKRPLAPKDKDAAGEEIPNSGGIKKATCDANVIRAWWTRWPKAMIAVALGLPIGAFVVDLDPGTDEKTGTVYTVESLTADIEGEIGCALPETVTAASPRGGRHIYLVPRLDEMPGNPKLFRAGVDGTRLERIDIKGTGGYVIVPPSVRHDGKMYEWLRSPRAVPVAACPPALLDCILKRGKWERGRASSGAPAQEKLATAKPPRLAPSPPARATRSVDDAIAVYVQAAVDAELRLVADAKHGTRNDTVSIAGIKLGQLVGAGGLTQGAVRDALVEICKRWPNLPKMVASIDSAIAKGMLSPRDLSEIADKAAERASRHAVRERVPDPGDYGDPSLSSHSPPQPRQGEGRDGATLTQDDQPSGPAPDDDDRGTEPAEEADEKPAALATRNIATLIERETFEACAALDQSDTDNAHRLINYVGDDMLVRAEDEVPAGSFLVWTGNHWDLANGAAGASKLAQRIGDLIKHEAESIVASKAEVKRIDAGAAAVIDLDALKAKGELGDTDRMRAVELMETIKSGANAQGAVYKRRSERRKFGISSKNKARISNMLDLAAPHLRRPPDAFNADALLVATRSHTLRFVREFDPENPDPDSVRVLDVRVDARASHARADLVTAMVPVDYDPKATCPRWRANLERFQPDPAQRRTVQSYAGAGITGLPIQLVMYHYGSGGNFKSVFLETLVRVMGDGFATGLPASAISGFAAPGAGGQATPELARLYGKRFLRVLELPVDQPLKADLIKKLTGGERFPVRTLFKGFFEYTPQAKTHMSGNGLPKFDGSDGGMRRRMIAVEWPIALAQAEQRDFEEVVSELTAEAPGILNWLIEGALDYLKNGLVIAEHIRVTTQAYIDENDPVGQFAAACIESAPGENVGARDMWHASTRWFEANGMKQMTETRFGTILKKTHPRDDTGNRRFYIDVRLHDVPEAERSGEPPTPDDMMGF